MKIEKFLSQSPSYQCIVAGNAVQKSLDRALDKYDLNWLQAFVLLALFFEKEKDVQPKDLQETFETSKGNISHTISHLESLKMIKRQLSATDRRVFYLRITKKGRQVSSQELVGFFNRLQDDIEERATPRRLNRWLLETNKLRDWHEPEELEL